MSTDISREAAELNRNIDEMKPTKEAIDATRHFFERHYPKRGLGLRIAVSETDLRDLASDAIDRATAALREENASMRTMLAHGAQELRKSLEAYKERDELRAECERLRQKLNSANQQHQL